MEKYLRALNAPTAGERLSALEKLCAMVKKGEIPVPLRGESINNHIHTTYSFSPYSPSKAVWMAYTAGLATAGIMDHDTICGAREFIKAGEIAKIATTIGVECRVDMSKTPLSGRRINNPDQDSIAYVALHGIPHTRIDEVSEFLLPYSKKRGERNEEMTRRLSEITSKAGISLDYERDVLPISNAKEGGSVTERHILFALAKKIVARYGKGEQSLSFLKDALKIKINKKTAAPLLDAHNPYYLYDLLGVMKSDFAKSFYIDAGEECPDVHAFVEFAKKTGAISAYAYLGDVGESVTGDKRAQRFEDGYLPLLFDTLKELGFNAVTYMPTRNTMAQLLTVKKLCGEYGFFEISGEDINSPRQEFVCAALEKPEFKNLFDSAWALIGHEKAATKDIEAAMFAKKAREHYPKLAERIQHYKKIGLSE